MRKEYEAPTLKLSLLEPCDIVTSSIEEDEGENDGEWT